MTTISEYIRNCDDEKLERLARQVHEEMKHRRRMRDAETLAAVTIGDIVRLKGLRPKYMNGAIAKVTDVRQTRVTVDIIQGRAFRGRSTTGIRVPAGCVTILDLDGEARMLLEGHG